jgi:hypothetical protein
MKYPVRLQNGVVIEVEGLEELLRLLKALQAQPELALQDSSKGQRVYPKRRKVTNEHLLSFLLAVKEAGEQGAPSKDLAKAAGLHSGKSISGAIPTWSRLFDENGLEWSQIVKNYQVGSLRHWRRGPLIDEAIACVKKQIQ